MSQRTLGLVCIALAILVPFGFMFGVKSESDDWEREGAGTVIVSTVPTPVVISPGSASSPGPTINTLKPTLQWQSVPNADYYAVAIRKDPPDGPIVYNPQAVYETSHIVPSGKLEYGHTYRWNIQAHGSWGWSAVSNTLYFTTPSLPTIGSFSTTIPQSGSGTPTISVYNPNDISIKVTRFEITLVDPSGFKGTMSIAGETKQITQGTYWTLNLDISAKGTIEIQVSITIASDCPQGTYTIKYKLSGTP